MNQPRVEHWSYDPYAEKVHELLGAAPALLNLVWYPQSF